MKISLTQHLDKINNLENLINQLKNDTTKDDLSEKIQEQIINRIRDIDLESYQVNCTILESDVYATIRNTLQKESGITTDEIWKQLDEVVNTVYPNFKIKLYYLYSKLNDSDYRMCLLIKCKFTINEIALLTFRGKNAIINRRTRLYFKLFGVKGSAIDLDRYILSL